MKTEEQIKERIEAVRRASKSREADGDAWAEFRVCMDTEADALEWVLKD